MTLAQLRTGQKARVVGFDNAGKFDQSLMFDQGIYEGAEVIVCNLAPFGSDPIAVEVNGSKLAIRKALAARIKIDLIKG